MTLFIPAHLSKMKQADNRAKKIMKAKCSKRKAEVGDSRTVYSEASTTQERLTRHCAVTAATTGLTQLLTCDRVNLGCRT